MPSSSAAIRSPLIFVIFFAPSHIAVLVFGSIEKPKLRGEPHGPQHSQVIFAESLGRVADGADDLFFEVCLSPVIVNHLFGDGVIEHRVDCEVPSGGVFAGVAKRTFEGCLPSA